MNTNGQRFSLATIEDTPSLAPPRIVVYGVHGIGKTHFAVGNPKMGLIGPEAPIVLRTEDGLSTLKVPTFPIAKSYANVMSAIETLFTEDHSYRTLVIDTLDWLEPLVWQQTALLEGKNHIEDFGYGKGYVKAEERWMDLIAGLDALRSRGMTVICLAHSEIKRFDSPETEPYDRYQMKLHKLASALFQEWADIVGFAHYEVFTETTTGGFNKKVTRGVGSGGRLLAVVERPAFYAKNRYSLPAILPFTWSALMQACAPAFAEDDAPAATEESTQETQPVTA